MLRNRGVRLRHKLVKISTWVLNQPRRKCLNPLAKFFTLARSLQNGAKRLCSSSSSSSYSKRVGYVRVGNDHFETEVIKAPKGHLAVYVGESEDETHRYVMPVLYFNHPLFGKLLKEAEKAYGFNHQGRIVIPCEVSEFETVKKKIAASERNHRRSWRHRRRRLISSDGFGDRD